MFKFWIFIFFIIIYLWNTNYNEKAWILSNKIVYKNNQLKTHSNNNKGVLLNLTNIKLSEINENSKIIKDSDENFEDLLIIKVRKTYNKKINSQKKDLYYIVQPGDSIYKIASWYGIKQSVLIKYNKLKNTKIFVGQRLYIPANNLKTAQSAPLIKKRTEHSFLWPLSIKGRISSRFGYRIHPITRLKSFHNGVDIAAPLNTPIKAARSGRVYFAGYRPISGKLVILKHPNTTFTIYAHCNKILVKKGQWVSQGKTLATVGNTGRSTGYHLHFGIKIGKKYVDPLKYIKK